MATTKTKAVTDLILNRILHSDHTTQGIPSERELSSSLGISRNTVRQAIGCLLKDGVLVRHGNGRPAVADAHAVVMRKRTIGFVSPTASADIELWRYGVQVALGGESVNFRSALYNHWADPLLTDFLRICDGIFMLRSEPIPELVLAMIRRSKCRLTVLDEDETAAGLPSVILFPRAEEVRLLDHLSGLGHRRIDCINTQVCEGVIQDRINTWAAYVQSHNLSGQLRSRPMYRPIEDAYRLVCDLLHQGHPLGTALFCTTGPAAVGAMRALHEAKLEIGRDVSVCAVNDEGQGRYLLKSLTALESPSRSLYLRKPVEWILGDNEWEGPLLVQPKSVNLFEGESTGPAPAESSVVVTSLG